MGRCSRLSLAATIALIAMSPALGQKFRSMKGWELYSWSEAGEWRFSLLVGTNRFKFCEEIRSAKGALTLEQAEGALSELAAIEYLSWHGPESFGRGDNCGLAYPPPEIVTRIRELARRLELNQYDRAPVPR